MIGEALAAAALRVRPVSDSPRLDSELLLAHVLGRDRSFLVAHSSDELDPGNTNRFDQLLARRFAGVPLAYLTGEKEFWSLKLKVTPDVLIPRPETELLVEWALELSNSSFPRKQESSFRIADLGTGSGCIALALAKELPQAHVSATDISEAALAVAMLNAKRLGISNIELHQGAWFSAFTSHASRLTPYDLIVSNPPYIAENDPHLATLAHEPELALTSGTDGLLALREISSNAADFLKPGGGLLLEHGAEQGSAVRELLNQAGLNHVQTRRDLAGNERVTAGRK